MAVKPWVGAIKAPSGFDESRLPELAAAPASRLEMAWVHGYRCRDAYANIAVSAGGDVLYPAAATLVAVVQSGGEEQHASRGFEQRHGVHHHDDVRSLAASPDGYLVATGGQGKVPEVVITDAAAPDIAVVTHRGPELENKRAIKALCFSPDGNQVVAACDDNDHTLLCFSAVATGGGLLDQVKGGTERILALAWDGKSGRLVSAGVKHFKVRRQPWLI